MRTLTLTTQKGGSGKTTLAASLAVAAIEDGLSVSLVDTDPQGSLKAWGQRRGVVVHPTAAAGHGADLLVIDTPGQAGPALSSAMRAADLCLMPVKPSIIDVEATAPTVAQLRILERPFAFVLNQCHPSSPGRSIDVATALVRHGQLAPAMITTRTDFLDAMTVGQGVTEFAPKGKAAGEIRLLWQWLKGTLHG